MARVSKEDQHANLMERAKKLEADSIRKQVLLVELEDCMIHCCLLCRAPRLIKAKNSNIPLNAPTKIFHTDECRYGKELMNE